MPIGIRVVEDERLRAEFLAIAQDLEPDGNRAQRLEEAAGAQRVTDALVDAVFERDVVVVRDARRAADLDTVDDIVGVLEGIEPVHRRERLPGAPTLLRDEQLDQLFHRAQAREVDIDQEDGAAGMAGNAQEIVDETRRKPAAGAQHDDLDRAVHGTGQAAGRRVLGVRGMTAGRGLRHGMGDWRRRRIYRRIRADLSRRGQPKSADAPATHLLIRSRPPRERAS